MNEDGSVIGFNGEKLNVGESVDVCIACDDNKEEYEAGDYLKIVSDDRPKINSTKHGTKFTSEIDGNKYELYNETWVRLSGVELPEGLNPLVSALVPVVAVYGRIKSTDLNIYREELKLSAIAMGLPVGGASITKLAGRSVSLPIAAGVSYLAVIADKIARMRNMIEHDNEKQ